MPQKVDKKQVEENLNKLLGTNIRFSKLSTSELEQLAEVLTNPEKLKKILGMPPMSPSDKIAVGIEGLAELIKDRPVVKLLLGAIEKEGQKS